LYRRQEASIPNGLPDRLLAGALKGICRATGADAAEAVLTAFEASVRGRRHSAIGQNRRRARSGVIPFFAFPGEVRRIIHTTTAVGTLNSKLRRAVGARSHFPPRRGRHQAALSDLEPIRERAENATP